MSYRALPVIHYRKRLRAYDQHGEMRGSPPYLRSAALAAMLAWCAIGCSEPRGPLSVKSDDPTLKIPAIKEDVRKRDSRDVAQMVKDLNDDDPAVRFYAIQGLRRLTGDTFDYRYYDDEDERRPAIERWQHWLKQRGKPHN
jgi:hypothetical protein